MPALRLLFLIFLTLIPGPASQAQQADQRTDPYRGQSIFGDSTYRKILEIAGERPLNFRGLQDTDILRQLNIRDGAGQVVLRPNLEVGIENFYRAGQTPTAFGEGLFSDLSCTAGFALFGLPVRVSGNVMVENSRVNRRLSGISLGFDYETFLEGYRKKLNRSTLLNTFRSMPVEQRDLLVLRSETEVYQAFVKGAAFQETKARTEHTIDSLRQNLLSPDQRLDSMQQVLNTLQGFEKQVDSIGQSLIEREAEVRQIVEDLQNKYYRQLQQTEEQLAKGTLQKFENEAVSDGKWSSILPYVRQLTLGSSWISGSAFDIVAVPVHGLSTEIRKNNYFLQIEVGKEGKQDRLLPEHLRNIRLGGLGRSVFYGKAGIGMPESSHVHLAFAQIRKPAGEANLSTGGFPQRNMIITMEARQSITRNFYLEGLASRSNADFTGSSTLRELLVGLSAINDQAGRNMAGLVRMGWKSPAGHSEFSIGYQSIGSEFVSLGNLFLVGNSKGLRLEARQRFWKSRVQVKVLYQGGESRTDDGLNPGRRQSRLSGEWSYRFGKKGNRCWFNYSPSYLVQQAAGSAPVHYRFDLMNTGIQINHGVRGNGGQWLTLFQATNYADQSQFGDTSTTTGLVYGMFSQTYVGKTYTLTALVNTGFEARKPRNFRDGFVDVSQTFYLKTLRLTQGLQLTKRYYETTWYAGGTLGLQAPVKKRLQVGLGITYLFGTSGGDPDQYYLSSSVKWRI